MKLTATGHRPGSIMTEFTPASIEEIEKLLKEMPNKTCALDTISAWIDKQCFKELAPSMRNIVNTSLSTGDFPDSLKLAYVTPIIKKPNLDKNILKNYRPVSNITIISKVIEKVVSQRLRDYLNSSNLDTKFQSAYKKEHSTETTLLEVLYDALRAADAKQPTLLVLLDLSAAFDTIDHELLLSILDYRFGINGAALQWLRSYLTGRMQSVFIDGVSSPVSSLQFGVPQGSVLGPLLFTLYTSPVADIAECYDIKYHLYAEDTQIYILLDADGQVQKKLVEDCVRDISKWMAVNKLKLNCDKTDVILLGSHRLLKDIDTRISIIIDNCKVTLSNHVKNLGCI
ncbi:reverse transcriptase-like protein [Elysia marginata]|uniref:Reverse transcriptase-like protein n=1 Tax=Elysia marginata TaxID=1093978 RepID=A0AAV4FJB3_9GAST|nr:reverse transcriptase-like protein [Elysia marginata]